MPSHCSRCCVFALSFFGNQTVFFCATAELPEEVCAGLNGLKLVKWNMRYSSWEDIHVCEGRIVPEIETTARSNSHLTTTTVRFCWGFTRLHDVFLFQIAPKWNEWIGSHSNSLPMWCYRDFKGLPLNVRIHPSSNVLPRSSTSFF